MADFLNLPSKEGQDNQNEILQRIADNMDTTSGAIKDAVDLANTAAAKAEDKITDVENRFQTLTTEQQQDAEVIDARQGKTSLVANIQEIKDDLMSHEAESATQLNSKADKIYVDTTKNNLNNRIDNIIATPTTVSEQEIIDARQGETSLGANLTAIKDDLAQHKLDYTELKDDFINYRNKIKLPDYGVDAMTYQERRNRLPYTALEYQKIKLDQVNSTLEGRPSYLYSVAPGHPVTIMFTLDSPISFLPYVAFDYLAKDGNFDNMRVDFRTDDSNLFRIMVEDTQITEGLNNLILNKVDVSYTLGNPDWNNITSIKIRITAKSTGNHYFEVGELCNYKYKGAVTVWFDDGHSSVYYKAKDIMESNGIKGVQAIVGNKIDTGSNFLTSSQLAILQSLGWEHTNHTYSHLKFGETTPELAEISLQRGLDYCLSHNFGKGSYYFVNPGGQSTPETDIFERNYCTLRRRGIGYNYLPITDMYSVKSIEPQWETSVEEVKEWIDTAIEGGLWLILLFHQIRPIDLPGYGRYEETAFAQIMQYLKSKWTTGELKVGTCSEVLSTI